MKKVLKKLLLTLAILFLTSASTTIHAQNYKTFDYTIKSGDSLWKICVAYQVGVSDILSVNPQITNPSMIIPGQIIKVPDLSEIKALENEVAVIVNQERLKAGLSPLKYNWQLARVARYKSEDMAAKNYFSHTSPTYGDPFAMMKNFGISFMSAGENIAYGQRTPSAVMIAWMNSPGHKANILNTRYTEIGVGAAKKINGTIIWTQQFIGR